MCNVQQVNNPCGEFLWMVIILIHNKAMLHLPNTFSNFYMSLFWITIPDLEDLTGTILQQHEDVLPYMNMISTDNSFTVPYDFII